MGTATIESRPRARLGRAAAVVALAFSVALFALSPPAEAAGLNLSVQMGQRFIGSASPARAMPLPLATKIGPIRSLAVAGINATSFSAIKDPLLGITIFSSSEVKQLVLDTVNGLSDNATLGFKIDSLTHPDTAEFTIGGNCVGADGANTPFCVANIVFKPTTPGVKSDPISAQITITVGMSDVENSLHDALSNQGIKGTIVNLIYPLIRSYVQDTLTSGIEGAMLAPVATLHGVGVAGPFTDPAVFIKRQYADFAAGTPTAAQISSWVKNFEGGGAPSTFVDTMRRGDPWHGRVAPVTRLYSAYFLRPPDTSGLNFWVSRSRNGMRLYAISSNFAASSEFKRRYGSLSDTDFVKLIYQNVLARKPDASGLAYWTRQLTKGQSRGRLMVGFSESSEYTRKQGPTTATVEIWFGMLHRGPTPAELTGYSARLASGTPSTTIIGEIMASTEYRTVVLG